jgi:hypothetical protein
MKLVYIGTVVDVLQVINNMSYYVMSSTTTRLFHITNDNYIHFTIEHKLICY